MAIAAVIAAEGGDAEALTHLRADSSGGPGAYMQLRNAGLGEICAFILCICGRDCWPVYVQLHMHFDSNQSIYLSISSSVTLYQGSGRRPVALKILLGAFIGGACGVQSQYIKDYTSVVGRTRVGKKHL